MGLVDTPRAQERRDFPVVWDVSLSLFIVFPSPPSIFLWLLFYLFLWQQPLVALYVGSSHCSPRQNLSLDMFQAFIFLPLCDKVTVFLMC